MKTITFVSAGLQKNGSVAMILNLASLLSEKYIVKIVTHFDNAEYKLPLNIKYIFSDTVRQGIFLKLYSKLKFIYQIYRQSTTSDLIICEESASIAIITAQICALTNKPIIIWNHSCRGEFIQTQGIINYLYKRSYQQATHTVNVSLYAQNCLLNFTNLNSSKISVIYNVIKTNNITNPNILDLDNIQLIGIGALDKNKNFELIINCLHQLKNKYNVKCTLTICGSGTYKTKLKELITKLGLGSYVVLYGIAQDVYPLISASHILISASNSEAFPLTVAEALSCNTPVIATNTGASEILNSGDYGTIIEKDNLEQMTNAILSIVNNYPQAKEKAILGNKSLSRFSEDKILPQWLELIERLT
ncbi:MAG: glycosyltransferase [Neisseriaceae bacterium]|nr:MAG: glycosyltransferase [Neisseriaceae bacterium]